MRSPCRIGGTRNMTEVPGFFFIPSQPVGAPFKPGFGLSGIPQQTVGDLPFLYSTPLTAAQIDKQCQY